MKHYSPPTAKAAKIKKEGKTMKIYKEDTLNNFDFWGQAKSNAAKLTYDELEQLTGIFEELYPDGIEETNLNDIMTFDFDWICEVLDLVIDNNGDIIIKGEEDEEEEDDE